MSEYDIKPYRDHGNSPPITFYMIDDTTKRMEKFSCNWCKRTIADIKGTVYNVVTTPTSVEEFGMAYNIRCKLCHQNYRFVTNPLIMVVDVQVLQRG